MTISPDKKRFTNYN